MKEERAGEPEGPGLLSPAELAPPIPHDTTFAERIRMWADITNTCEQFLKAGLRREIGPDGDLEAAFRQWYEQQREEHDRAMRHLLEELYRRLGARG